MFNPWVWLSATFMWIVCAALAVACWNAGKVFAVLLLMIIIAVIVVLVGMEITSHRED